MKFSWPSFKMPVFKLPKQQTWMFVLGVAVLLFVVLLVKRSFDVEGFQTNDPAYTCPSGYTLVATTVGGVVVRKCTKDSINVVSNTDNVTKEDCRGLGTPVYANNTWQYQYTNDECSALSSPTKVGNYHAWLQMCFINGTSAWSPNFGTYCQVYAVPGGVVNPTCSLGYKNTGTATAPVCTACPSNSISNSDRSACLTCLTGSSPDSSKTVCVCNSGYKKSGDATTPTCTACPSNSISNSDRSACLTCLTGSSPDSSKTVCVCNSGYTKSGDATTPTCTACPSNSTSNTARTVCICNNNYVNNGGTSTAPICATCPTNSSITGSKDQGGGTDTSTCKCNTGYIKTGGTSTNPTCTRCPTDTTSNSDNSKCICANANFTNWGTATAPVCSQCPAGYTAVTDPSTPYSQGTACLKCTNSATQSKTLLTNLDFGMKGFCGVCPLGETPTISKTKGCSGNSNLSFEAAEQPVCMNAPNRSEWIPGSNPSTSNTGASTTYKCSSSSSSYGTERAPPPNGCIVLKNKDGYAGNLSPGGADAMIPNATTYLWSGFFSSALGYGTLKDPKSLLWVNWSKYPENDPDRMYGYNFRNFFQLVDYSTPIPAPGALAAGSVPVGGRCAIHADCQTVFGTSPNTYNKAVYCINNKCQEKIVCKTNNTTVNYGWNF